MRLYRLLLGLYPASFRREYGDDMCAAFEARYRGARGVFFVALVGAAAIGDVVPNAGAAHLAMFNDDARRALRSFRRTRVYVAGIVALLALGIGANGAVYGILRAVLLRPLPYQNPDRVVMVWRAANAQPGRAGGLVWDRSGRDRGILTSEMVLGWRDETRALFSDYAAINSWDGNPDVQYDAVFDDRAQRLRGAEVTANFFELLGARAEIGRLFASADDSSNAPMLVISHAMWERAFAGDPGAVGRAVTLTGGLGSARTARSAIIIGVLPREFRFTYPEETEAWMMTPWSAVRARSPHALTYRVVARLAPGVSFEAAQARVHAITTGLVFPGISERSRDVIRLEPVTDWAVSEVRPSLILLGAIAGLLLLITCATVANAVLVRTDARRRDLAVRAALGADPRRLMRQLLTEGALLASFGAVAGSALTMIAAPALRRLAPGSMPRADEISASAWVIAFAAALAAITTILAVLAPAWRGAHVDLHGTLQRRSGTASSDRATQRWRAALVGTQAAIASVLLVSATLLLVSFWRLGHVPLGFNGQHVITMETRLYNPKFFAQGTTSTFQAEVLRRIRAIPGVLDVGLASAVPFRGTDFRVRVRRQGDSTNIAGVEVRLRYVDPAYFSVMQIGLARGRLLTAGDDQTAPKVSLLSESAAKAIFGADNPLGRVLDGGNAQIVGVVHDARYRSMDQDPEPALYLPIAQHESGLACFVVQTSASLTAIGPALIRAVHDADPSVPAMNLSTMDRIVRDSIAGRRFYTIAAAAFASLSILLTVVGLVVVISRAVTERRLELAIRGALGAPFEHLIAIVARDGLVPATLGVLVGLVLSLRGATLLAPFLFHVQSRQPLLYVAVGLGVTLVATMATLVPAARAATNIAPAEVLRSDA